jgi:CubicO group peptidase (beta-lactamase class C family)
VSLARRRILGVAAAAAVPPLATAFSAAAQPAAKADEVTAAERAAMAKRAEAFMRQYDVPALSVAAGRAGSVAYEDAFGWANREKRDAVTPNHLFRIASVSKPITSIALFSLIDEGRLRLGDRVFGPGAITGTDYGKPPYRPGVADITIEHLLTHTGGGWRNDRNDPMFTNPGLDHATLIDLTLRNRPLDQAPGQQYAYSNFGFCVLGRVIEKLTGQSYAAYVQNAVLQRCGVNGMTIAGNTPAERKPAEVSYYGQGDDPYGMNVTRMDSHGGWIARPADVVRIFMHVGGFAAPTNILKRQTIQTMTTATAANRRYAKGWAVNDDDNWWHNGSLPGTATIAVRTHSGYFWAVFANTRRRNSPLEADLDKLAWNMVREVRGWRV